MPYRPPNAGIGRKKGVPNKSTASIREAILAAFDKLGREKWLIKFAKTHPAEFARLLGRLLPREVQVTNPTSAAPNTALSNPDVLAAALALDEAVDAVSHSTGARPADASTLPVGTVPPYASVAPTEAHDQATLPTERQPVPPSTGDDPAAAC